jgi:hypothetical protein
LKCRILMLDSCLRLGLILIGVQLKFGAFSFCWSGSNVQPYRMESEGEDHDLQPSCWCFVQKPWDKLCVDLIVP